MGSQGDSSISAAQICSAIVACLCVVVFALSMSSVFIPWTSFGVDKTLPDKVAVNSSSLAAVYRQWPQMFYSRGRHLEKVCFTGMNETTWIQDFARKPKICGKSANKCYCLTNVEYENPVNVSSYPLSDQVRTQQSLFSGCLGLMIIVIILSFCLFLPAILTHTSPKILGTITFIFVIVEECAIIAIVIMYSAADTSEEDITLPPHYGFVLSDSMLSAASSKSRTHGFALCCSLVVFVSLKLIFYICSWLMYLCSPATPETHLSTNGNNYGSSDEFAK